MQTSTVGDIENEDIDVNRIMQDAVMSSWNWSRTDSGYDDAVSGPLPRRDALSTLERIGRQSGQCYFHGIRSDHAFLEDLYDLGESEHGSGVATVFDWINQMLLHGGTGACDDILRAVDVHRLPYSVMLSFLTFTFAARHELTNRDDLFLRIRSRIEAERGSAEAEELLKTLT